MQLKKMPKISSLVEKSHNKTLAIQNSQTLIDGDGPVASLL